MYVFPSPSSPTASLCPSGLILIQYAEESYMNVCANWSSRACRTPGLQTTDHFGGSGSCSEETISSFRPGVMGVGVIWEELRWWAISGLYGWLVFDNAAGKWGGRIEEALSILGCERRRPPWSTRRQSGTETDAALLVEPWPVEVVIGRTEAFLDASFSLQAWHMLSRRSSNSTLRFATVDDLG